MKENKFYFAAIFCCVFTFGYLMVTKMQSSHRAEGYTCSGNLMINESEENFTANLVFFLNMRKDNTGFIDITGEANYNGSITTLGRNYSFSYKNEEDDIVKLYNVKAQSDAKDNSEDKIIRRFILNSNEQADKYFKISPVGNMFIVSNLYSPVLFCLK